MSVLPAPSCTACWRAALGPGRPCPIPRGGTALISFRLHSARGSVHSKKASETTSPPRSLPNLSPELAPSTSHVPKNPHLRLCSSRTPSTGQTLLLAWRLLRVARHRQEGRGLRFTVRRVQEGGEGQGEEGNRWEVVLTFRVGKTRKALQGGSKGSGRSRALAWPRESSAKRVWPG